MSSVINEKQFNTRLNRVVLIPFLLGVALAIALTGQISTLLSVAERVDHSDSIIGETMLTRALFFDAVTRHRGYLITSNRRFLIPMNSSLSRAEVTLNQLILELADKPGEREHAVQIQRSIHDWKKEQEGYIRDVPKKRDWFIHNNNLLDIADLDAIRSNFDTFVAEEERIRALCIKTRFQVTRQVFGKVGVLAIGMGLLLAFFVRAQLVAAISSYRQMLKMVQDSTHKLKSSEERTTTTLNSIADAVIATDQSGTITFINPVAQQLTGWSSPDALGLNITHVLNLTCDIAGKENESVLLMPEDENRYRQSENITLCSRDLRNIPIELSRAIIHDDEGRNTGEVLVFHDITMRKKNERDLQRLAAMVESSSNAIIGKTSEGIITDWNPGAERLYGYTPEEIIGQNISTIVPPDLMEQLAEIMYKINIGERTEQQDTVRVRKDGTRINISATISPLRDARGNIVGASTIAVDITQRKITEQELISQKAHIQLLNERLQRAMAETHHRVKNNLQIISALVDMQVLDHKEMVPVSQLKRLGMHIRTLASIHDLLTLETRDDADINFISAGVALERLLPMLQTATGVKDITMDMEEVNLPVRQGTSLTVAVNELVSNAAKHGNGHVKVSLRIVGSNVHLVVMDDGPGFAPDFDPVNAANTGLELIENISRWDLNGKTSYTNSPEGGGCVTLIFPLP